MEARDGKPTQLCPMCCEPVRRLPATGKYVNADGRAHDPVHTDMMKVAKLAVVDVLSEGQLRKAGISEVAADEKYADGFFVVVNDIGYHFRIMGFGPMPGKEEKMKRVHNL